MRSSAHPGLRCVTGDAEDASPPGVVEDTAVPGGAVVWGRFTVVVVGADDGLAGAVLAGVWRDAVTVGAADDDGAVDEQAGSARTTASEALTRTTRRQRRG